MSYKLPEAYIIQKFYQYVGFPKFKKTTQTYVGCCPICREGKSWGKKKRLFYIPKKDLLYCQNCVRGWSPLNWLKEVSHLSFEEIVKESSNFNSDQFEYTKEVPIIKQTSSVLPEDSINLFDKQQINYYKNNQVIQDALGFIKKRKLDVMVNKPRSLFISLKDFIHKNRLCIPFYNIKGDIEFYQTRAIYKKDEIDRPKYLSRLNADKTIFGLDNINPELDYIFIFEGPIDSMCIQNGVAIGGIDLTEKQQEQLQRYNLYNKIWVLDNQLDNHEVKTKMNNLIEQNELVFIWPDKFKDFKDINEICQKFNLNQISPKFFIENAYNGIEAMMKLSS